MKQHMTTEEFMALKEGDHIVDVKTGEVKTVYGVKDTKYYRMVYTSAALDTISCITDMVVDGNYQSFTRWKRFEEMATGAASEQAVA